MTDRAKHLTLVVTGVCFVLMMVTGSVLFSLSDGAIPQTILETSETGEIIGSAPFHPSLDFPFGTDRDGYDLFFKVLQGAQYTLGAAIMISLLSFVVSFVLGILGGFVTSSYYEWSQNVLSSFYFIPQSIIAYNVLFPLLWEPPQGFETTLTERVVWSVVSLGVITVPTTAILIANETRELLQKEFIMSARVLGGSRFFLFRKHLMPHLRMRLFIIFPKITIQVLLIIAHLGFFQLFFGGTDVCYGPFCDPPKPIVNEWSGLMAMNFNELFNAWWIFMVPMLFFSLTILSLNGITKGLEGMVSSEQKMLPKQRNHESIHKGGKGIGRLTEEDFEPVLNRKVTG
ncbi:hypothetical protein LCL98_10295 [Rossellomorea aquimaris]|nr:hypothetical protein [Rossellomorea aquimaris]